MNSIEKQECKSALGTSEGVTMEDYFDYMEAIMGVNRDDIKQAFKDSYPDESVWSF
jgi:hypothetical protein